MVALYLSYLRLVENAIIGESPIVVSLCSADGRWGANGNDWID